MWFYYLVPVIAIAGVFLYSAYMKKRVASLVAQGQGPELFHQAYAGQFTSMTADERIVALWRGQAHTGDQSTAGRLMGGALNELSKHAVGVSKYVPLVSVALTSSGRVHVAEEFSKGGKRGYFREARVYPPGAVATDHGAEGHVPKNPFDPRAPMTLTELSGAGTESYVCWLGTQGIDLKNQQTPAHRMLPVTAEQAASVWTEAQSAAAPAPGA